MSYESAGVDPIVIYPDIVSGNPLSARRVVRYSSRLPRPQRRRQIFSQHGSGLGILHADRSRCRNRERVVPPLLGPADLSSAR